jgi:hypothetical protein
MIPVEDDEQSAYQAARAALTARYGHLVLKFTPPCRPAGSTKRHGPAGQSVPTLSTNCWPSSAPPWGTAAGRVTCR